MSIHSNEISGVWMERVGGELAMRGTYSSAGIELLIKAISAADGPLTVKKDKLKYANENHVRLADSERLSAAFDANKDKVPSVAVTDPAAELAAQALAEVSAARPGEAAAEVAPDGSFVDRRSRASSVDDVNAAAAGAAPAAAQLQRQGTVKLSAADAKAAAEADAKAAAAPAADANAAATTDPKAAEAAKAAELADGAPEGGAPAADAETAPTAAGATARAKTEREKPAKKKAPAASKEEKKAKEEKEKKAAEAKEAEAEGKEEGGKKQSSGYGGYGQPKKSKKKVEKVVVEEKVSPFANSPLMIAMSTLAVRTGPTHDTPLVETCHKILPGSLVRVGGTESLSTKEKLMTKPVIETRMHIELDGDQEPLGWVTGISKDEIETLRLAARGFPLMRAVKTLAVRETQEHDAPKCGEIHKDVSVRVMETTVTEDGHEKALVAREGAVATSVGWVTTLVPGKEDISLLVPTPMLPVTFDLRVHTANSLTRQLDKSSVVDVAARKTRKDGDGGLPFQVALKRPKFGDQDGPTESRHKIVETPATLKLVFNCFNSAYAVTSWTGKEHPFEKLPLEQSFDLLLKTNRKKRVGRVKMAYTLGMPFLERVEFPNEWYVAEDYDLNNDGWQASATLELEIVWGKEVATITVQPWLAYAASIGARMVLRKQGAPSGQCATVQRILQVRKASDCR